MGTRDSVPRSTTGLKLNVSKLAVRQGNRPSLGLYAECRPDAKRMFGEQTRMFAELAAYADERGMDVAVLPPGYRRTGRGWRWHSATKRWQSADVSLPGVVLRRSGTSRNVAPRIVTEDLNYFNAEGCLHTLPLTCSNKWVFYRKMSESAQLRDHLPGTHFVQSKDEVHRLLHQYGDIYVKPLNGARGVSIFRLYLVNQMPLAIWERRVKRSGRSNLHDVEVVERELPTAADFDRFWRATGFQRCLVQETIRVPRTREGRPFDFRWLIQCTHDMEVMARVARIGDVKSVTTNIHTGGRAVPAEQAVAHVSPHHIDEVIAAVDRVALAVAKRLQRLYGPFAEVGIDLALRNSGEVVVFEVNPTPGRRMLRSLPGNIREMSLHCLVEYAIRANGISAGSHQ
ncbi:YheC/YheD family protein [Alicyclobacillus pomorum]|jgi:YheC/D like ATP-grasp|uniref:YheC/YheD family protein n=1 Tax=Alicyclobacillus pomorum TaxID=204470 RepID=UPI00041439D9|nr:YheC/YheD family protein [Alicyclobacillus pomorum]